MEITTVSEAESLLELIDQVLKTGKFDPSYLPRDPVIRKRLDEIILTIRAVQNFALDLSNGDLDSAVDVKGFSIGCLKSLQSNLRHLTWQAQQIAEGDFSQHIDFMGGFSDAFNHMVRALDAARVEMKQRELELSTLNARLLTEVTVRRNVEETLRESEEKYRSILKASPDDVTITDMEGFIKMVSPAALTIFGFEREDEILGQHLENFIVPKDRERAAANIALMHKGIFTGLGEYRAIHSDGSTFDIEVNGEFIRNHSGDPSSMVFVVRDITKRKQVEKALHQANEKLNLLSGITRHDIKNKVITIEGFLRFARKSKDIQEIEPFLNKIYDSAKAIENQIEFSKNYQDLGIKSPKWLNFSNIVIMAGNPAIHIINETGDLQIFADPLFEKVMYNLTDNTIRHGESATEVRISIYSGKDDIRIIWSDNGVGVPPDNKENIFHRGFGKNTGLGLFLIREILAITGMTIKETGEPGKGARFEITVPNGMWRTGNE